MLRAGIVALTVLVLLGAAPAHAQLRRETSPVAQPGYGLAAPDVPEAVVLNPAALAFLPSWGLAYVHADSGEDARMLRGNGFYAASPLLFGLAAGVAVDSVRPTPGLAQGERTMISLALAWGWLDAISVGAALRVLASGDVRLASLTTLDLAASWRPASWLAFTFMARDVTAPRLGGTLESVPRSFLLGTGLRPFGDRSLTLDLAGIVDEDGRLGGRASAEVTVPYVGRALAALEAEDVDGTAEVRVTAGLAVDWAQVGVGGGVHVGDGYGDSPGWYATARIEGRERPGVPRGAYVLELTLEGLGPRGIVRAVRQLDRALHDPRVVGVLLKPRGSGVGLAYAQELRLMIDALRERGKRVVCHLDDAAGSEWYACAGADRILLDPAGGVRLTGPSSEIVLLGDLLRNVGIRADFVRIGEHKTAIEQYMNSRQTVPARQQTDAVLDWAYRRLVFDAGRDLDETGARIAEIIDQGPHLPEQAEELGLVHALVDERDMDEELRDAFGGSFPREQGFAAEVPARWGNRPRIGVVVIDGTIADGENVDIPLIGIQMSGGRTVARAIDRLAGDPAVVAIVLRIDSPGGSVLASDQIYRAILRARERKPVIASMGAVAASGGYYVAAPAHEIWADPSTVTGSIGIWFGKVDFQPLGELIGATLEERGRGRHAGATSLYRPFTAEERAVLARSVRHWYRSFLRRVARGRNMSVRDVDALGRGRLWMGDQAVENGLVDHLGGFGSALDAARRAAGVGPEVEIEIVPWRPATILDYVLGAIGIASTPVDGISAETGAAESQAAILDRLAPELRAALASLVTLRQLGSAAPMALAPEVGLPR
jgi:protease-4